MDPRGGKAFSVDWSRGVGSWREAAFFKLRRCSVALLSQKRSFLLLQLKLRVQMELDNHFIPHYPLQIIIDDF
jgi:hypothetical protein